MRVNTHRKGVLSLNDVTFGKFSGAVARRDSPRRRSFSAILRPCRRFVRGSAKVAAANVPVLITGESGTGKDIIARLIHGLSPWKIGPYVKVNCPAIPGNVAGKRTVRLRKGAFTGAFGSKPGRVELAHRGTLFLDEISELDPSLAIEAAAAFAGRAVMPDRRPGR